MDVTGYVRSIFESAIGSILKFSFDAGQSAFHDQFARVHQRCQCGCHVSTDVAHSAASDVVDANCVVVVPVTGFASNHDVLSHSRFTPVVADAHDASVEDAIELPMLVSILVIVV